MPSSFKRTTVTAALPYANGPLHIGHLAGCYIPADIYVRYLRSQGEEVLFICGSDEHGVAITIKARKEGLSPQQLVDQYHRLMKETFRSFDVSFDWYSRTSSAIHHETASEFFSHIATHSDALVKKETMQFYDEQEQQFLADRYIEGTCPVCAYPKAYGDQCENCGSTLSPSDLIDPVSKLSGTKPVRKETSHWFLALDKYTDWLKDYVLNQHSDWKTNVLGQCRSWLESGEGLQPRSMTRDMDWGVKVPAILPGSEGKVLYVWFDAPIGYISATKEWAIDAGKDWSPWWQSEDTRLIHFIGKDNIVFHCIIFPVILKTHGDFILPDQVPANEFLNLEGQKISTSRNWAVWAHEYLTDFPGMQDVLRYVLTANAPETKDNDFTWKEFQTRNNSELVAILGNFINRVMVLCHKYYEGKVPVEQREFVAEMPITQELWQNVNQELKAMDKNLRGFKFRDALACWMNIARLGNKYLTELEPWKKYKAGEENAEVAGILCVCLEITTILSANGEHFLPRTCAKINQMLSLERQVVKTENIGKPLFTSGHQLGTAEILFRKIEDEEINQQTDKLKMMSEVSKTEEKSDKEATKKQISYDHFAQLELKTARVIAAERVPKTDKLLKITLDAGETELRTVVSGIAMSYTPEEIIGKEVMLLANLEPRNIRGITSHGMLLLAEDENGKLAFMSPERSLGPGNKIS
jgi:methionyl-tRNA synthetase